MDDDRPQGPVNRRVPPGDNRERLMCDSCGFVLYANPKVVVGAVAAFEDRILLVRRAIHPRKGYWTLPAGYMELGETTEAGARREAREEACAELDLERLLAVYNIPRISQVQVIYAARLVSPDVEAGEETSEVGLFAWDELPWDDLAFPSVRWALNHWKEQRDSGDLATRTNPEGERGDYTGDGPV